MTLTGSCLCQAIQFEVRGALTDACACHCIQCRKQSGHYEASANVNRDHLLIKDDTELAWYHSSKKVRRGFCMKCGSSLFWDPTDRRKHDWTAIALGAFDGPMEIELEKHIFVSEKGSYYQLGDGLPQMER